MSVQKDEFTLLMEREYPEWGSVWAQAEAETGKTMKSPVERIMDYTPPALSHDERRWVKEWEARYGLDSYEDDDYYGFHWPPPPGEEY